MKFVEPRPFANPNLAGLTSLSFFQLAQSWRSAMDESLKRQILKLLEPAFQLRLLHRASSSRNFHATMSRIGLRAAPI
jgi:hypothetical protein